MIEYLITYRCPNCGHVWHEVYSCACDSECPECDTRNIEALRYRVLTEDAAPRRDVQAGERPEGQIE